MFTINDEDVMNVKDLIHFFDSGLDFTLNNNQIKNVLKGMDENGNGKIHYGEFYLLVLFVTCDKNRDGFITYDEAKYMAGKFDEYSMTVEQIKNDRKEFDKDDTNGDGKLDYVEFRRAIMEDVDNLAEFKYSYLLK